MTTSTVEKTMLYCPKCQRKYDDGSQRFCNNDGGRLLPAVNEGVKRQNQSKGVFTNLLAKTSNRNEKDEILSKNPRFVKTDNVEPKFDTTRKNKVFKTEQNLKPNFSKPKPQTKPILKEEAKPVESSKPKQTIKSEIDANRDDTQKTNKPLSRLITTKNDINLGRAELGDRKKNPTGRLALNWANPNILHGQTIKGRYKVVESFDRDHASLAYLAEDQIHTGKKVIVRVLMEQTAFDEFQNKLLSEERVSLSHIIHPNIAKVLDSGELPEGKPFIVTEYVENESVKAYLQKTGVFNTMRTARIIRQSSMALSEVHQNGILHRNLQPQHLLLTVSEAGNETVKVADFCVSDGKATKENFNYKAPEQIKGQLPTFASDSYSLAVIAFEMLTARLPFKGNTSAELLKSQKVGLTIEASNLNPDVSPIVDSILTKALAYNPSDRYPKARDFGEALFNALTTATPWDNKLEPKPKITNVSEVTKQKEKITLPHMPIGISSNQETEENTEISSEINDFESDIHIESNEAVLDVEELNDTYPGSREEEFEENIKKGTGKTDTLWKKRSPEPTKEGGSLFTLLSIVGLLVLVIAAFATWNYFSGLEDPKPEVAQNNELESEVRPAQGVDSETNKNLTVTDDIDPPPRPRDVETPKGFKYFENSKQNLSPELAKEFRGFSVTYPEDWKVKKFDKNRDKIDDKFLDVANESDGIPIAEFMISPYDSSGTFSKDKKLFPKLVEKSNTDISKALSGNYEVVSEGETTIQNGRWKAYQVNFRTKEKGVVNGKEIELWGRRLWIPVQRPGVKTGFIITMFASSLSKDVSSADDVGKKGDLAKILETFEPAQNY